MNCKKQLAKANTKHVEMNIYSLKLLFATGLQSNSNVNWDLLAFFPKKLHTIHILLLFPYYNLSLFTHDSDPIITTVATHTSNATCLKYTFSRRRQSLLQ